MFLQGSLWGRPSAVALFFLSSWTAVEPPHARAAAPALEFDLGRTVECRDVTEDLLEAAESGQRLIECTLRISVQHLAGDFDHVQDIRIEVSDCDRSMRVHSFAPTTLLKSQHTSDVVRTKTNESTNTVGITLGGELPAAIGDVVAHVTPSLSGSHTGREVVTEKQSRIPPKEVVVASGTIEQQHGVFFRLRPTPQTTLEGVHELTVRFLVPEGWRGDTIVVRSNASGVQKFLWLKQQKDWATEQHRVVLYMAGDEAARRAAERHAQRRL